MNLLNNYISPTIKFEELTFFERIADRCWGAKSLTFDYPYDCEYDPIASCFTISKGCGKQTSSILKWLKSNLSKKEYRTWEKRNNSCGSNLTNTKADGFDLSCSS